LIVTGRIESNKGDRDSASNRFRMQLGRGGLETRGYPSTQLEVAVFTSAGGSAISGALSGREGGEGGEKLPRA